MRTFTIVSKNGYTVNIKADVVITGKNEIEFYAFPHGLICTFLKKEVEVIEKR